MTEEVEMSSGPGAGSGSERNRKQPRRVIHCSDGIIEEYSTDEEEVQARNIPDVGQVEVVDPKKLQWLPWMAHYTWAFGSGLLSYCDYYGEKLAWFFGITSPKYFYELEEFHRQQEEEIERNKRMEDRMQGWETNNSN